MGKRGDELISRGDGAGSAQAECDSGKAGLILAYDFELNSFAAPSAR